VGRLASGDPTHEVAELCREGVDFEVAWLLVNVLGARIVKTERTAA
jgi:hypothetical protein